MKFNVGDYVRIKSIAEHNAEGHLIVTDCAIALWENRICTVEHVVGNRGYKLWFIDPQQNSEKWNGHMSVNDFVWEEANLVLYEQHDIQTDLYEDLINGVIR